ncbi:MAG TPA: hypothetical protein PK760_14650, partial [Flavobacteriales bacterium]|nr:hypothetical protein [Flavobacteriales bacterium]
MTDAADEKDFFDGRLPEYTYVSKAFTGLGSVNAEKRFIWRKILVDGQDRLERIMVDGEYLLRRSPRGAIQVRLLVTQTDSSI